MWPKTRSSRSPTLAISSSSCFSAIFRLRWPATVSASLLRLLDLVERNQHLGRDLLVELDVLLELRRPPCGRAPPAPWPRVTWSGIGSTKASKYALGLLEAGDAGAPAALDQHLHGAVGQLQQLQDRGDGADAIDVVGRGIVLGGVLLGDQQDLLVVLHHRFERADRFLAADEQRHDHVRENDDVAQRQHGKQLAPRRLGVPSGRPAFPGLADRLHVMVDLLMDSRRAIRPAAARTDASSGLDRPGFTAVDIGSRCTTGARP